MRYVNLSTQGYFSPTCKTNMLLCHGILKLRPQSRHEEHTGQQPTRLLMRIKVLMCLQVLPTKLRTHASVVCHKQLNHSTSSANNCSFSAQDSISGRVSRTSAASSLMHLDPFLMVSKALSRSFLSWRSRVVRLGRPSSSGVWKLEEEQEKNPGSRFTYLTRSQN